MPSQKSAQKALLLSISLNKMIFGMCAQICRHFFNLHPPTRARLTKWLHRRGQFLIQVAFSWAILTFSRPKRPIILLVYVLLPWELPLPLNNCIFLRQVASQIQYKLRTFRCVKIRGILKQVHLPENDMSTVVIFQRHVAVRNALYFSTFRGRLRKGKIFPSPLRENAN